MGFESSHMHVDCEGRHTRGLSFPTVCNHINSLHQFTRGAVQTKFKRRRILTLPQLLSSCRRECPFVNHDHTPSPNRLRARTVEWTEKRKSVLLHSAFIVAGNRTNPPQNHITDPKNIATNTSLTPWYQSSWRKRGVSSSLSVWTSLPEHAWQGVECTH